MFGFKFSASFQYSTAAEKIKGLPGKYRRMPPAFPISPRLRRHSPGGLGKGCGRGAKAAMKKAGIFLRGMVVYW
jgi:hypothetical protein